MCFNQDGAIFSLNSKPQKLVDLFIYLGSNIASTESDINLRIGKACTAIDKSSTTWQSNLSDRIKREFFRVSTTVWLHDLDSNKPPKEKATWELHKDAACYSTKKLLCSHLSPTQERRCVGYCHWSRNQRCLPMDSDTCTHQCWPTRKNLHSSALYEYHQEDWLRLFAILEQQRALLRVRRRWKNVLKIYIIRLAIKSKF